MRYFFDTEFHEDGKTIDLISIGIVCEDGREYYAISADADYLRAYQNEWLREHVLSQIPLRVSATEGTVDAVWAEMDNPYVVSRTLLAKQVLDFVAHTPADPPEFWAYYADYDWIVMCQLFGKMIDHPKGWPMYCRDIKQVADMLGGVRLPAQEGGEHNALEDARWNWIAFRHLAEFAEDHPEMWRL